MVNQKSHEALSSNPKRYFVLSAHGARPVEEQNGTDLKVGHYTEPARRRRYEIKADPSPRTKRGDSG